MSSFHESECERETIKDLGFWQNFQLLETNQEFEILNVIRFPAPGNNQGFSILKVKFSTLAPGKQSRI